MQAYGSFLKRPKPKNHRSYTNLAGIDHPTIVTARSNKEPKEKQLSQIELKGLRKKEIRNLRARSLAIITENTKVV